MDSWQYKPATDLELPVVDRARSVRREPGLLSTLGHTLCYALTLSYFRLYHRLRVEGAENLPTELPFVLIANHSSHLDALALTTLLPRRLCGRIFPIAAGDVFFETPATSFASSVFLNALPMWRKCCGPHALAEFRAKLVDAPCGYILFPEGARSRDGQMQSFKPGLGMLTAATPAAIVPCHLQGTFESFPPGAHFPRPHPIRLRIGRPLLFDTIPNDRDGWHHIASAAESAVRQLAP